MRDQADALGPRDEVGALPAGQAHARGYQVTDYALHGCAIQDSLIEAPGQQPQRAVHREPFLVADISGHCFVNDRDPAVNRDPGEDRSFVRRPARVKWISAVASKTMLAMGLGPDG